MGLLTGIKVVDFTTYIAGSSCTRMLADWKADVIKVEPLKGEAFRIWGRLLGTPIEAEENPCFEVGNANKKGIAIDAKSPEGEEILNRLLKDADIFVTNYREKALDSMGLDYETLSQKYPKIIYGFLNGYGEKGPLAQAPGFDVISFWGRGGFLGFFGEPDAPPVSPHPAGGDMISGTFLAGGILAALIGREKTGRGEKVSASLYHSALWAAGMHNLACNYWENPKKSHFTPHAPLINSFKTRDEKWFSLAIMEHERFWPKVCKCIDRLDLAENPDYAILKNASKSTKEITEILDAAFITKTMAEWKDILGAEDIAADMIFTGHDIIVDEQALVNGYMRPVVFPNGHTAVLPTSPCAFREEGEIEWKLSPYIGRDTKEVLLTHGYSEDEIKAMADKGLIVAGEG
jgi:crotonobetainyl-CoA:carnitine CoA-transferase CaiB-like acyl-CoA transferase